MFKSCPLKSIGKHWFVLILLIGGCKSYKQNIMFKTEDEFVFNNIRQESDELIGNYEIQTNDQLYIEVYTNAGERIIDPDLELNKITTQGNIQKPNPKYLVENDGQVNFPLVGKINLEGQTLQEANAILSEAYSNYYNDPYVITSFANKRVVVLGAPGGQIVPINNEKVTLSEVLAMSGGLENDSRANNIRVIRGEKVFLADFSTIEGYKKSEMIVQSGDIVYVEPVRRPFAEATRDIAPTVSLLTSVITLIIVIITL